MKYKILLFQLYNKNIIANCVCFVNTIDDIFELFSTFYLLWHISGAKAPPILCNLRVLRDPYPTHAVRNRKTHKHFSAASLMRPHCPKICVEQQRKLKLSARYFLAHLHIFLPKISKKPSLFSCDFQQKHAVTNGKYLVIMNESRFFPKN